MSNSGNGNDMVLRRWHIYLALATLALPSGKILFSAGGTDARTEEKMVVFQQRLDRDEQELARKDVLDPKINSIEKSQAEMKTQLDAQGEKLQRILELELQRRH